MCPLPLLMASTLYPLGSKAGLKQPRLWIAKSSTPLPPSMVCFSSELHIHGVNYTRIQFLAYDSVGFEARFHRCRFCIVKAYECGGLPPVEWYWLVADIEG
jgi:hypothetical protein